jgi:predicted ATPase/DNA-binding SARP family transcriptional activator
MDTPWRIELLGRLRAIRGEQVVTHFRAQRTARLLAYLAYYRDRPHPREVLTELLWPEADPHSGRRNLSRELTFLRRQLEPTDAPVDSVILADRYHVALDPAAVTTDVACFEAPAGAARKATDPVERICRLSEAVDAYTGPLLPGFCDVWVLPERERLAEEYLQALDRLALEHEQAGNRAAAIHWLRQAVAADPLREESRHTLIRLLIDAGEPAAAVREYEAIRRLLSEHLDAAPGPELEALIEPVRPAGKTLAPLSSSRLPPRLPTAFAPGAESPAPFVKEAPSPSRLSHEGRLPLSLTRFFGREPEIAGLQSRLRPGEDRLVTLTGPGGSGKTRLALQVARQLREAYDGAVWFIPLLDLNAAALIAEKLREVLGLPSTATGDPINQVVTRLSGHPALLVLDNFEHLVEEGAAAVRSLLERVERLTVLATSRQLLGLPGEQEFPVAPLPVPGAPGSAGVSPACRTEPGEMPALPEALLQSPSVRLFADRAQAARPDFQLTEANAAAVAQLCARLEGLPLAIELAAARAPVLTPAQMLARLDQRFELLVGRQRTVDPRHRSLRTTLDWSYSLLSPEVQRFFERLSVFRGGWSLEAAEAVCEAGGAEGAFWGQGPGRALDFLEQLRQNSLVLGEEESRKPAGGEMRYRFLETIREYAAERLNERQEGSDLRRRHLAYFLALAEESLQTPPGQDPPPEWLDRCRREHENLRQALDGSLSTEEIQREGLRLAAAVWPFWEQYAYLREGRAWLRRALDGNPGAPISLRARATHGMFELACRQDDFPAARAIGDEWLALARLMEDKAALADAFQRVADVAQRVGDFQVACSLLETTLSLSRELQDRKREINALGARGYLAFRQRDDDTARLLWEQSLLLSRAPDDRPAVVHRLGQLAELALRREDPAAALAFQRERWVEARALGGARGAVAQLIAQAEIALLQQDEEALHDIYSRALALPHVWSGKREVGDGLGHIAWLAFNQSHYDAARTLMEQQLAVLRERSDHNYTYALIILSRVAQFQGDLATARTFAEKSLHGSREQDIRPGIARALRELGMIAVRQSHLPDSFAFLSESLLTYTERPTPGYWGHAEAVEGLAQVALATGDYHRTARLLGAAVMLREDGGKHPTPFYPYEQPEHERVLAAVRSGLGEEAFAIAWTEGRRMTVEQAIAFALDEAVRPDPASPDAHCPRHASACSRASRDRS